MKNFLGPPARKSQKIFILGLFVSLWFAGCAEFTFPPSEARLDDQGRLILPKGPYQVVGNDGEVLVGVQLPETEQAGIEDGVLTYWIEDEEGESVSVPLDFAWDRLHYARLDDLEPGVSYQMKVTTSQHVTEHYPIRLANPSQDNFSFLVVGDTKPYPSDIAGPLVEMMNEIPAAFYVHLGDFAREGDHVGDWSNFLEYHRPLLTKMPIVPVIGNHDRSKYLVFSNVFMLPQKSGLLRRYYKFEHGNTMVIVLDAYVDYSYGSAQYAFVELALNESRKDTFDHVFIASHKPFYSTGTHGGDEDLRKHLLPLVEKYSVTAVLAAHDHSYQRTKPINGVVHFIIGGGGAKLKKVTYADYTARAVKSNHFAEIIIEGPNAYVRAYDLDGEIIDEARIR